MNILYITTFNKKMWEVSGKNMVESFLRTNCEGKMLICYEGLKFSIKNFSPDMIAKAKDSVLLYNIEESEFLRSWLSENKDAIPPDMGGKANERNCPMAFLPWNLRAAGWFRKIVTFDYAMNTYGRDFDAIVFVDSDCEFKKGISSNLIEKAFNNTHVFYHWGKHRPQKGLGVESGFIGFTMDKQGKEILQYWIDKYKGKEFRRYARWDDGGMFSNVLIERKDIPVNDLVGDYESEGRKSHVVEHGMFKNYLVHNKGMHRNIGITNDKRK